MPCVRPLNGYRTSNGEIVFNELRRYDIIRAVSLPCGQCIECRLLKSRVWALRCMHEAKSHKYNSFVTLTYDEKNLPARGVLRHEDFQKFMKRLRKHYAPEKVRFYMCGEYGEQSGRPHFHAALFGARFGDQQYLQTTPSEARLYSSDLLTRLWGHGHASVGALTFESAAYIARYCVSKITGDQAKFHYARRDKEGEYQLPPEYNKSSLKPGLGYDFYQKYRNDMYPHDYCIHNGKELPTPKYYDKMYKKEEPESYEEIQYEREKRGRENYQDNTPERLKVKEQVTKAKLKKLPRNYQ